MNNIYYYGLLNVKSRLLGMITGKQYKFYLVKIIIVQTNYFLKEYKLFFSVK